MNFCTKQARDYKVKFGANLQGLNSSDESTAIKTFFNSNYIRASVLNLSSYAGGALTGLSGKYTAGMRIWANISWEGGSDAKLFPTDLSTYENKLELFCTSNAVYLRDGGAVIENEPDNGVYWNFSTNAGAIAPFTTVSDYLAQLGVAVSVFHKHGVKVADGCVHLKAVKGVQAGGSLSAVEHRVDDLLTGYSSINIDYCNFHFTTPDTPDITSSNTAMQNNIIKTLAGYMKTRTGRQAICNEWHQEAAGTNSDEDTLCASIVSELNKAHTHICLNFGGDGSSDALILVDTGTHALTHLGTAYASAITSLA